MNSQKDLMINNARLGERLARHTSFKIGGPAAIWTDPKDIGELKKVLSYAKKKKMPVFVLGGGSNILINDKGFNGIIIHLGSPFFKKIGVRGSTVRVGAGYSLSGLVNFCCKKGLAGLESLIGIPGTLGGAIFMNAGGWQSPIYRNIGDCVASLKVMDHEGNIKILKKDRMHFGYRSSNLSRYIILEAVIRLRRENARALASRCSDFFNMKRQKQVLDCPSAGCVFKNPANYQFTAGQMIDMLGLKGRRIGGAEVSKKHANFIINRTNNATSMDVSRLIELIQEKVKENYNINLELEIKVI